MCKGNGAGLLVDNVCKCRENVYGSRYQERKQKRKRSTEISIVLYLSNHTCSFMWKDAGTWPILVKQFSVWMLKNIYGLTAVNQKPKNHYLMNINIRWLQTEESKRAEFEFIALTHVLISLRKSRILLFPQLWVNIRRD